MVPVPGTWAALFSNYIDAAKSLTIHVYPQILKQLSTEEVKILMFIKESSQRVIRVVERSQGLQGPVESVPDIFFLDQVSNIERLGLIQGITEITTNTEKINMPVMPFKPKRNDYTMLPPDRYKLSVFGKQFLEACQR